MTKVWLDKGEGNTDNANDDDKVEDGQECETLVSPTGCSYKRVHPSRARRGGENKSTRGERA